MNDRQCARFILLHERVEGEQLQLFILLRLRRHRIVALAMNLDFQCAAFLSPISLAVRMLELGADLESTGGIALLIFGICFPIQGCFRPCSMLRGEIREDLLRLSPMGIVDGPRTFRVERLFLRLSGCVVNHQRKRRLRTQRRRSR